MQKRYGGQNLVKEVRALEKLDFKYRKALLVLNSLISCRTNNAILKFLYFKVSNEQLRSSTGYITCQKRLLNQEVLNKQKVVILFQPVLETIKNNFSAKLNSIDCIHDCIDNVKDTQSKKLSNLLISNKQYF